MWIALHGPGGEDGTLQGALDYLGVPYTGSGVMGSAIGMDKLRTKRLAQAIGVATTDFVVLRGPEDFATALERLGLPLIVKPATQGSIGRHDQGRQGGRARRRLRRRRAARDPRVRRAVDARQGVHGGDPAGGGAAVHPHRDAQDFYDYEAKYFRDDTRYFCPAGLNEGAEAHLKNLALAAFEAAGASGWGRADFMMDAASRPQLLEINTIPGMTSHSLVPMAAQGGRHRFRGAGVARARDELHAARGAAGRSGGEDVSVLGRPKNRRKPTQERLRLPAVPWRALGLVAGALALAAVIGAAVAWALNQPIQTVAVAGRFQRVAPVDVERVVKATVHGEGLLSVDLAAVRRAIHTIPWVDAVSVQRAWPRGLNVLVIEQTAAARWGEHGLLNTRGELFDTDERHIPPELAELQGPDGKESVVAQRYLAAEGRLMQAGLRMTALRLDARGAWEFDLANGVTVRLGRRQVDERFEKFMSTALKLVTQRGEDIAYIDMRYTNGFAVGWRGNAAHAAAREGGHDA